MKYFLLSFDEIFFVKYPDLAVEDSPARQCRHYSEGGRHTWQRREHTDLSHTARILAGTPLERNIEF